MLETTHITHALACHAEWKDRLREAINTGASDWDVASAQLDDQCDFGQWLRALSPEDRGAHWQTVVDRHHAVHQAAAGVLALALTGRHREAEDALHPGGEFAERSRELTHEMTAWQHELSEPVLYA